jgi:predicted AAA+ superfamily ATPase
LGRESLSRRQAWFKSYITTILQRDIRDLANIDALTSIPDILKIMAIRCAQPLNIADISRSLKIPQTSLKRYLALLESTFLTYRVLPWHGNLNSRLVKTPKVYMNDTGLAAHLLGIDEAGLAGNPTLTGQLFENFVASELVKQIPWSKQQPGMFHFRTHTGREVDIVLENAQGRCIGIEVKSGAHVTSHDAGGLFFLKETIGNRFYRGIILYTGTETIPFDERIHAIPISALWS